MSDIVRTIAEIRAGRVARLTRTELLDLCDEAAAATAMRGGASSQMTDAEVNEAIVRERDELRSQRDEMHERLQRILSLASGRGRP